ncbi:MAG: AI-2E family transporter [Okeania sp. SIO2C9]|uniref:AI-2E family transporter n=1 Tax=Okeania sp. SIO2C9 TaxID=2607791 RepID=UPI0013C17EA1|nr:AI-2E family transporter [Okeania sp. SIO2C9]NEQ74930.1 AI-2E family transporter [Okeania sp. SIO2C9]
MNLGNWIGLFAILAAIYILWQIRQLLLLVFTAVVIATTLNKLARWLQRFRINRPLAVLISVSLFILIIVTFLWVIVPPLTEQFQQLITIVPLGINKLNDWLNILKEQLPIQLREQLPNIDINEVITQLQPIFNQLINNAGEFVGNTFGIFLSLLLILVLTIMMLVNPSAYRQGFIQLFPNFYRQRVNLILNHCEIVLGGWVIGTLINMSVIALLSFIGLSILQLPLASAQAVLAGLLTLMPNIGPTLSVIPPMAIALIDSPLKSGLVLFIYILIQQIGGNILTPYVMAKQVSLLPAITLIFQVFFASFFGFSGLLLALPLTIIAQVWIKELLIKDILDNWQVKNFSYERNTVNTISKFAEINHNQVEDQIDSEVEEVEDKTTEDLPKSSSQEEN